MSGDLNGGALPLAESLDGAYAPRDAAKDAAATTVVRRHARDEDDLAELLGMLGLTA